MPTEKTNRPQGRTTIARHDIGSQTVTVRSYGFAQCNCGCGRIYEAGDFRFNADGGFVLDCPHGNRAFDR